MDFIPGIVQPIVMENLKTHVFKFSLLHFFYLNVKPKKYDKKHTNFFPFSVGNFWGIVNSTNKVNK